MSTEDTRTLHMGDLCSGGILWNPGNAIGTIEITQGDSTRMNDDKFQENKVELFEHFPSEEDDEAEHLVHGLQTSRAALQLRRNQLVRTRKRLDFLIAQIDEEL